MNTDYKPFDDDNHGIALKKSDKVEVMEELEGGRCFVRATTISGQVIYLVHCSWLTSNWFRIVLTRWAG